MRWIGPQGPFDLTYCTNVHPGESLDEVMKYLGGPTSAIRQAIVGQGKLGLGLRLAAPAVADLTGRPEFRKAFARFLQERGFEAWTVNGFPYGAFHSPRVKEDVFRPTWLDPARMEYTEQLADILIGLLGDRDFGTISTLSGQYKPWGHNARTLWQIAIHLAQLAWKLAKKRKETGKQIMICLEAEPFSTLETIDELIIFFSRYLYRGAAGELAASAGVSLAEAMAALSDHLGVCFDTAHHAVEFEKLTESLQALKMAGIPVGKIQISNAIHVPRPSEDPERAKELMAFAEPRYLHQVVGLGGRGRCLAAPDLEGFLGLGDPQWTNCEAWRCHFHVPVFLERIGRLETTRGAVEALVRHAVREGSCRQFEIETYTWDVLPAAALARIGARPGEDPLVIGIIREFGWVSGILRGEGCRPE